MKAKCMLCPRGCEIEEGQTGACRARANKNGGIVSLNYGKITALALDPIEKKPLMHFHPGSMILSVGSFGCSMRCPFCQNHEISMKGEDAVSIAVSPDKLAQKAYELRGKGNIGLAYTYNEPLIGYEFVRDCAAEIHGKGMLNVIVTNGFIEKKAWEELLVNIDAVNIDLKCFNKDGYLRLGGNLETVRDSIITAAKMCHTEITALIIPNENDSREEMRDMAEWLASVDENIPLHISRYFPDYRDIRPPTPVKTVYSLVSIAKKYLKRVYPGNC